MDQPDKQQKKEKARGKLKRLTGDEVATGIHFLRAAAIYLQPDDITQRQAFAAFMPDLFVLRSMDCSFSDLANLLRECGLKLQPSTIRTYYNEMLEDQMEACQKRLEEHRQLAAECRNEFRGQDISTIAEKLAELDAATKAPAAPTTE